MMKIGAKDIIALGQAYAKSGRTGDLEALNNVFIVGNFTANIVSSSGGIKEVVANLHKDQELEDSISQSGLVDAARILRQAFADCRHFVKTGSVLSQTNALNHLEHVAHCSSELGHHISVAKKQLLSGDADHADGASCVLRTAMASIVGPTQHNERVAYMGVRMQGNEGHMMCPKSAVEIGHAVPMEASKCRDHCIDSRTTVEGIVTCGFMDWLRVAADASQSAHKRFDEQGAKVAKPDSLRGDNVEIDNLERMIDSKRKVIVLKRLPPKDFDPKHDKPIATKLETEHLESDKVEADELAIENRLGDTQKETDEKDGFIEQQLEAADCWLDKDDEEAIEALLRKYVEDHDLNYVDKKSTK